MGDRASPPPGASNLGPNLAALVDHLAELNIENRRDNAQTLHGFAQLLQEREARASLAPAGGKGPQPKTPRQYDGDRADGKLDDHIRDLENWVHFYERRNHWGDEAEKVEQSATYLTGKMHRMFDLQRHQILTFPDYVQWLRATFRDNNENIKLREEWRQCIQDRRSVMEYATDLLYLAARIEPHKMDQEVKEHFRTGLDGRLQISIAEHPEWEQLTLNEYIGRVDNQAQIEAAKDRVRREVGPYHQGHLAAVTVTEPVEQLFAARDPRRGPGPTGRTTRNPGSIRKGTAAWQDYCYKNKACYNCAGLGHGTRECTKPRSTDNTITPTNDGAPKAGAPVATARSRGLPGRRNFKGAKPSGKAWA